MRRLPVIVLAAGLAFGPGQVTAQWGVSVEIGAARFSGTSRDSTGATVGPHRPTTVAVRVDRGDRTVRLAVSALHTEPGLAGQEGDLAFVQYGVLSLWEFTPEIAVRVARFGAGVEARIEAGPAFDLWTFDGEQRNRIGARGGVAIAWPLARSLAGSLRVTGAWSPSMVDPDDVPSGVERVGTRRFDVAIGLRYGL